MNIGSIAGRKGLLLFMTTLLLGERGESELHFTASLQITAAFGTSDFMSLEYMYGKLSLKI